MVSEAQSQFIDKLKEWLAEYSTEMEVTEHDDMLFLRVMWPLFSHKDESAAAEGTSEDGKVVPIQSPPRPNDKILIEVSLLEYDESFSVAQFYSTLIFGPGPGLPLLRSRLNEWNFGALVGSYGIYEEYGQLYHKHCVALWDEDETEVQVAHAFSGLILAVDEMRRHFREAQVISLLRPNSGRR